MRILVTNDDGINAPGLALLEEIARDLAGPAGEVWVVAPAFEQSGVAHKISYTHPMMLSRLDERRFVAEGSPADCVLAGLHDVLDGTPPDLVLVGVNRGNNAGENVLYSGTVGGAMEGALQGIPSVALSQYIGEGNLATGDIFAAARTHARPLLERLIAESPWESEGYRLFFNINFPPLPAEAVRGVRIAHQGLRSDAHFSVEPHFSPSGRKFLWVRGGPQHRPADPGSDVTLCLEGYVTVTPMRADLTAHDRLVALGRALDETLAASAGKGAAPNEVETLDE